MQKILFTGDSLIEYFEWAARFPEHRIHNMGWSGETVEGPVGLEARESAFNDAISLLTG